jgi:voltage-gated potassium channel
MTRLEGKPAEAFDAKVPTTSFCGPKLRISQDLRAHFIVSFAKCIFRRVFVNHSNHKILVIKVIATLAALPVIGTIGFSQIEGWSLFDSLYMSMITLSTVGYSEVHPLSTAGRTFVMVYLVIGLSLFVYSLSQFGELIVRVELMQLIGKRRRSKQVQSLTDHFIVCGIGRVGLSICQYLSERKLSFIAIDKDPQSILECQNRGWTYIDGDATDDRILKEAGIARAKGLAAVLSSDSDNVFVVLSARLLSKSIQIISRASSDKVEDKLKLAGADRVVSLYTTGAHRMAQFMTNSKLHEFVEVFNERGKELDLAEIQITKSSPYAGQSIEQIDFAKQGVMIVGLRKEAGSLVIPPPPREIIGAGDCLVAVGKAQEIALICKNA